jgi:hypothetical protein
MEVFEFSVFYVLCFTALFSLTPLGHFPPRDIIFTTPGLFLGTIQLVAPMYFDIPWVQSIVVIGVAGLALIVGLSLISNVSFTVLGTGVSWNFNAKYVCTIVMGGVMAGGLGVTMSQMLPTDVPLLVTFFLVWVWMLLLIYSVIMYAGAGGTGN